MNLYTKYKNKLKTVIVLSGFLLVFSCQSAEEKTDSAYEEAKVSKEFTDDSLQMEKESAPLIPAKPLKVVIVNHWTNYSVGVEKEIKINEKMISDLRAASGSDVKIFKKITALEKKNHELKNRLLVFNQEAEENFEKFKADLKSDMIELEKELEELTAVYQKK